MNINNSNKQKWLTDIATSIKQYNEWFINFAPNAYQYARNETADSVRIILKLSNYGANISPEFLHSNPKSLFILRMCTAPPIARDRLIGLSEVKKSLVNQMEKNGKLPKRMNESELHQQLKQIAQTITLMIDPELFSWIKQKRDPKEIEIQKILLVVGDRVCRSIADSLIRNAQEARQLSVLKSILIEKGYHQLSNKMSVTIYNMPIGTYSFHMNVPVQSKNKQKITMPIDMVIRPYNGANPILIEAKSAGDFTNVNKRRKEEAIKVRQLHATYGEKVRFFLFLCGYFNHNYLNYEAAEGIDWIWEHRPEDLLKLNLEK